MTSDIPRVFGMLKSTEVKVSNWDFNKTLELNGLENVINKKGFMAENEEIRGVVFEFNSQNDLDKGMEFLELHFKKKVKHFFLVQNGGCLLLMMYDSDSSELRTKANSLGSSFAGECSHSASFRLNLK